MKNALRRTPALFAFAALTAAAACSPRESANPSSPGPARRSTDSRSVTPARGADAPWQRRAQRAFSRPDRIVRYAARGSSAFPDVELVRYGEVIGRVTSDWSGPPGAATVRRRKLTLYGDGGRARTFELPAGERMSPASGGSVSPSPFRSVAAPARGGAFGVAGFAACDAQFDAVFDAIDGYWAADAALGECFTSPSGCLGAAIGLLDSSRELVAAEEGLGACLAVT